METTEYAYTTERIDQLGIVAGICQQINLIEGSDESLPTPAGRKVSCGQAVQAMVRNALGLTSRALSLMPESRRTKPVDLLGGEGLVADDFNDDPVGRALDEVQQAGVTEIDAAVAGNALDVFGIASRDHHLDTSSFGLHGAYESEGAPRAVERDGAVEVRHGYSKDLTRISVRQEKLR